MAIGEKNFKKEIAICRKLYKKSKGCKWGKCKDCGAVPLLYKLSKKIVVEEKKDIKKLKNFYLN